MHFGQFPSETVAADRLLQPLPFGSWWKYFEMSFSGLRTSAHPDEWRLLLSFMGLYIVTVGAVILRLRKSFHSLGWESGITISLLPLLFLYAFFGDVVMETHWGYLKAISIFYFVALIQFHHLLACQRFIGFAALLCCFLIPFRTFIDSSMRYPGIRYVEHLEYWKKDQVKAAAENSPCLNLPLKVEILNVSHFNSRPWLNSILGRMPIYLFQVRVSSSAPLSLPIAKKKGRITFSMIQANSNGQIVSRGVPTVLQAPVINQSLFLIDIPFMTPLKGEKLGVAFHQKECGPEQVYYPR